MGNGAWTRPRATNYAHKHEKEPDPKEMKKSNDVVEEVAATIAGHEPGTAGTAAGERAGPSLQKPSLAMRRKSIDLQVKAKECREMRNGDRGNRKGLTHCKAISDLYILGEEVMPSGNTGMQVLFAKRVSDGADVVIKTRCKKTSFHGKGDELFWLHSTEMLLNIPRSENIAQVHELIEDGHTYYIVMEKAKGDDLFEILCRERFLDMDVVKDILRQILHALEELHGRGCVHRDVKLENLVVSSPGRLPSKCRKDNHESLSQSSTRDLSTDERSSNSTTVSEEHQASVKLVDFDTVEPFSPCRHKRVVGTDQYIALESYDGHYSPASDVFSVGVIAYKLISGRFPFKKTMFDDAPGENFVGSPKMVRIRERLKNFHIDFERDPWPEETDARDLTEWMLRDDEAQRPSASQALSHPFLDRSGAPRIQNVKRISEKEVTEKPSFHMPPAN